MLTPESDPRAGRILLGLARAEIAHHFGPRPHCDTAAAWLAEPGASFVTLTKDGHLRGCIGSVEAHRSLLDDVRHNAVAAAFTDPRFPPLTAAEVAATRIEVSVLAPSEPVAFDTREELAAKLRPGVDGVILSWHGHRGTFLPQVWEQLPKASDFLDHLLAKAGLPASFWSQEVKVRRYTVSAWQEPEAASS